MKDSVSGGELNLGVRESAENPSNFTRSASDSGESMRAALVRQMEPARREEESRAPPGIPDHELLHRIGGGAYGEV